jgi:hypothetical protein
VFFFPLVSERPRLYIMLGWVEEGCAIEAELTHRLAQCRKYLGTATLCAALLRTRWLFQAMDRFASLAVAPLQLPGIPALECPRPSELAAAPNPTSWTVCTSTRRQPFSSRTPSCCENDREEIELGCKHTPPSSTLRKRLGIAVVLKSDGASKYLLFGLAQAVV